MFFILSKLITILIMPISLVVIIFVLSFFWKKYAKTLNTGGIVLLLFFSNPFLANQAMRWWETPAIPINQLDKSYDVGIVLCGVTNPLQKPNDRVHFSNGADRIIHAVQLYKEGRIDKILISGGSGYLLHQDASESQDLFRFSTMAGVKKKDIILENESRNTHENAAFSKQILQDQKSNKKLLLITSAFHIPRAKACFNKEGVQPDIFPTDLHSIEQEYTPDSLVVPSIAAIGTWTVLIREWLGMIAYKLAGYI